ncbi:hypothetical protein SAMN05216551_1092 [Chitinasiproducens palmae]|uniref:Uncharacterized protein n=1 Tax=Chitinasiproducens palmae TaxID=1770053 RepID=A0A1H2PTM5_9BURK|nr:hypothetical protein SAMN05216551_1092 [Chitinasiproducens palmae]
MLSGNGKCAAECGLRCRCGVPPRMNGIGCRTVRDHDLMPQGVVWLALAPETWRCFLPRLPCVDLSCYAMQTAAELGIPSDHVRDRRAPAELALSPCDLWGRQLNGCKTAHRDVATTGRKPNGPTAQRPNGPTAQRPNGTTAQRHNGTTAQRHNGTTAQRHGGTAARRHGGTAARRRQITQRNGTRANARLDVSDPVSPTRASACSASLHARRSSLMVSAPNLLASVVASAWIRSSTRARSDIACVRAGGRVKYWHGYRRGQNRFGQSLVDKSMPGRSGRSTFRAG